MNIKIQQFQLIILLFICTTQMGMAQMDDFSRKKIKLPQSTTVEILQEAPELYYSEYTIPDTPQIPLEIPQEPESKPKTADDVYNELTKKLQKEQNKIPQFLRQEVNNPKKWSTFTQTHGEVLHKKRYGEFAMGKKREFYQPKVEFDGNIPSPWIDVKEDDFKDVEKDQFLGTFHVNGEYAEFKFHDHGQEDNDQINISNNSQIIIPRIVLKNYVKTIKIPLQIGFNKINIMALNRGKLGPNTGAMSLWNKQNEKLLENAWRYNTGSKDKLVIIREK